MQRATASQDRFVCLFIIVVLSPRTLQFSLNISLVQLLHIPPYGIRHFLRYEDVR